MENVSNGTHRGPVPRVIIKPEALAREAKERDGEKGNLTESEKLEEKRRKAREYYHANKGRASSPKKAKREGKKLPVVSGEGGPPAVPKRPSKVDALVCINRSLVFLRQGDTDGAELWSRFAARIIEGRE